MKVHPSTTKPEPLKTAPPETSPEARERLRRLLQEARRRVFGSTAPGWQGKKKLID